ncbi:cadmium resistance transporter [Paraburkholderia ultramafica]|nr:cadmium resistance transporter [Paraburkholderia ultramafica]
MTAAARAGMVLTGRPAIDASPHFRLDLPMGAAPFSQRCIDRLSRMFSLALLAIAAYAATNIDNLFVLLAFLGEARTGRRRVIAGQYAGSLILIAGSLLLAALLTHLPAGYAGLLGILPIGVGLSKAWERFGPGNAQQQEAARNGASAAAGTPASTDPACMTGAAPASRGSSSWTVAGVAIANGSDNLAVYVPLYASHSHGENAFISLVFVVMIGLWCAAAVWLVEHPLLGAPIRRYGTALLPLILLAIGVSVIVQNDTLRIVFGI